MPQSICFTRLHFTYSNRLHALKSGKMKWNEIRKFMTHAHIEIEMQIYRYFANEFDGICNQICVDYIFMISYAYPAIICNLSFYIHISHSVPILLMIVMRKWLEFSDFWISLHASTNHYRSISTKWQHAYDWVNDTNKHTWWFY